MLANLYACAFCNESFSNSKALVSHVQSKHVPVNSSEAKIGKDCIDFKDQGSAFDINFESGKILAAKTTLVSQIIVQME